MLASGTQIAAAAAITTSTIVTAHTVAPVDLVVRFLTRSLIREIGLFAGAEDLEVQAAKCITAQPMPTATHKMTIEVR